MDDILKFQRLQGPLDEVFKSEKICAASIDTNHLVLGTESGMIYIVNFAGQIIKSIKSHTKAVNDISVDNSIGLTIVSCSDTGSVEMLLPDDNKQLTINFNEPLKKICVEKFDRSNANNSANSSRKERSFVVGSASGRLIYHRTAWFSHKDIILFSGGGSEVISIAWKGHLVAWADMTQVRIMDIATQTAICRLSPPLGVGIDDPYPCSLFWQSDCDLLIGWADSFRQVAVSPEDTANGGGGGGNTGNEVARTAKTLVEWQADCIICGVYPFDANHVVMLGYSPPAEEEGAAAAAPPADGSPSHGRNPSQERYEELNHNNWHNYPEILIAKRVNGELVSADTLPLRGCGDDDSQNVNVSRSYNSTASFLHALNLKGPFNFRLLSTYQCTNSIKDVYKWDLSSYRTIRGGDRGFAPTNFVISSGDMVIARLRDVNDRVAIALSHQNLKLAVELAKSDQKGLKKYKFHELLSVYLIDLLERGQYAVAASECERLIENDIKLWEAWIYKFKSYNQLSHIAGIIPIDAASGGGGGGARLNTFIYEEVITSLIDENPAVFLEIVRKWSKLKIRHETTGELVPLFNHDNLLAILQNKRERSCESNLLEAQAQLYIMRKDYENALGCYMDIKVTPDVLSSGSSSAGSGAVALGTSPLSSSIGGGGGGLVPSSSSGNLDPATAVVAQRALEAKGQVVSNIQAQAVHNEYRHVFELFDQQPALFRAIEYKVINLVRLSKPLSAKLLISNIDKLPIKSVASQLSADKKLLFWYLHTLFTDAPDIYCNPEYSDLHLRQMELYAEFAPKRTTGKPAAAAATDGTSAVEPPPAVQPTRTKIPDSEFLTFLKASLVPLRQALTECERQDPPLHLEMIYILSQLNRPQDALQIHLHELRDVSMAIEFIENHIQNTDTSTMISGNSSPHPPSAMNARGGFGDMPKYESFSAAAMQNNKSSSLDNPLWDLLIAHALANKDYLIQLLDYLGICRLAPERLIRQIDDNPTIPYLKLRLCRILSQLDFQVFLNERCNVLLEEDALSLLRQQNQGQRKAMKVDSQMRCTACSRPICMDPGSALNAAGATALRGLIDKSTAQVWGSRSAGGGASSKTYHHASNGIIVFSNKIAFHKVCYDRIQN